MRRASLTLSPGDGTELEPLLTPYGEAVEGYRWKPTSA